MISRLLFSLGRFLNLNMENLPMTKRSVLTVLILTIITFGIYALVWFVKTKREMVQAGADIPTSWLIIFPFINIYWIWKWSGGVDHVTKGKSSQAVSFILIFVLGIIGMAIIQSTFNGLPEDGQNALSPRAPST
jgi:hypothetical protein